MDDCHVLTLTSSDGAKLCARHWQAANPTATLALVHGFGEHSGRYTDMGGTLSARGVDVFAVDLRGHGRSEGKRGIIASYDDFRADLGALLEHVRGAAKTKTVALYGHSMGGGIVLDHGLRGGAHVQGIFASAPMIATPEPIPAPVEKVARLMSKIAPKASMKNVITGEQISTLAAEQKEYERDPLNHARLGFRTAVSMVERGQEMSQQAESWPHALPLLMVHSRGDQLTDFAASQDFAVRAGADFRAFDKTEHELHNDTARAEVYDLIEGFAKGLEKGPTKEV